jgi:cytosine/adenosine deaminase-related metal-dependent hydrolase
VARRLAARHAWTPDGLRQGVCVVVDDHGRVLAVEEAAPEDSVLDGILMPGLVNAHAHLELSQLRGQVPGGSGSVAWVRAMWVTGLPPDPAANRAAAAEARATGTRALIDTSNRGDTAESMRAAGLQGVVQIEVLGLTEGRWRPALDAARKRTGSRQLRIRPTAHSPVSCSPALLLDALQPGGPWPTVHVDEDPADLALLGRHAGPWAGFHEAIGHDWRTLLGAAPSGLALLDQLGILRRELGLVHLCAARPRDLDAVARAGSTVVLCPRSNLHIGGQLPDVDAMVARGIPLAIGTDSLASTPDLDLLAEAAVLRARFPGVPPEIWLRALTEGGARLLGEPGLGALRPGSFPGLLLVETPPSYAPLATLLDGSRWPRRWLA